MSLRLFIVAFAILAAAEEFKASYQDVFYMPRPSFLELTAPHDGATSLLISTFSAMPWGKGTLEIVPNINEKLSNFNQIEPILVSDELNWPNDVRMVPEEVFGRKAVHIPYGFLVPGHKNGGVKVATLKDDYTLGELH